MNKVHHIFPQASQFVTFFRKNKVNINGVLLKLDGSMHQYGLHNKRFDGGPWNEIWRGFTNKNDGLRNNPYYVLGFGFGLLERVLPLMAY